MASLNFSLLIFLLQLTLSLSSTLILPLTKSPSTHHYMTRIHRGSKLEPVELVVDLNSPFIWLDCSSSSTPKPTPVHCRSIQCTSAAPYPCPSLSNQACSLHLQNPTTGATAPGELVESTISFQNDQIPAVDSFLLSCSPAKLLAGLPSNSKGVFGLGRTRVGPVSQISHIFEYPKKFSVCLSKNGMIAFGNDESEVLKSMIYTPLLSLKDDSSYVIPLKSVRIQNKRVPLEGLSSIKISTADLYSKLETRVYQEFVQAFASEAEALNPNIVRVPPHGGFEICYGAEMFTVSPVIDLVLQSEMVKWRVYGHNSLVRMNNDVICLGFLDGGDDLKGSSIFLGAHQLEDNLLEFDLGSSMLGFSSSLLKMQTSCDQLSSSVMVQQQQVVQSS